MTKKIDSIYAKQKNPEPFTFDEKVVEVFPDMIHRSVPGYQRIIEGIGSLSNQFIQAGSLVYDLGCSLGAATLSIRNQSSIQDFEIIGLDNSQAMVNRCTQHINAYKSKIKTSIICADITDFNFKPCSLIVINFTLQFLKLSQREQLLQKLCSVLKPGGALILSEKIEFEDDYMSELFVHLHHQFKKSNGYSDLEISQKIVF